MRLSAIAEKGERAPPRNGERAKETNGDGFFFSLSLSRSKQLFCLFSSSSVTLSLSSLSLYPSLSLFPLPLSLLTLAGERTPLEHGHGLAAKGPPPQRRVKPDGGIEDVRQCERRQRGRVGGVAKGEPSCGEGPHF